MGKQKTINLLNAIDSTTFIIVFDRQFTPNEEENILSLKELLKDDLSDFSQNIRFEVKFENNEIINHEPKKSGIKLQSIEPNGKSSWVLQLLDNQIIITCQSYDRWKNVWYKANKFMLAALSVLDKDSLKITSCVLQYIDRFIGSSVDYNLYDIFDKKNKFLTKNSLEVGSLWHIHQGWFDDAHENFRILNVLNLGTNNELDKIITTIDHNSHMQFKEFISVSHYLLNDKFHEKTFLDLHLNNKSVMNLLLNAAQKKVIKLNG